MYDYILRGVEFDYVIFEIPVSSRSDVVIADLASELTASDGLIFASGGYYKMETMQADGERLTIFAWQLDNPEGGNNYGIQ